MAWDDISGVSGGGETHSVKLLSDTYTVDVKNRTILSDSCNVPAKEHVSIIILHYLAAKLRSGGLPPQRGEWIDFKELEGGEGYYPAFKRRTIDKILKKYGAETEGSTIILEAMDGVPILITVSEGDDEFAPDANILFDRSISSIFRTEDIVVLTEIAAHSI